MRTRGQAGCLTLELAGELDFSSVARVRAAVDRLGCDFDRVDVRDLDFIDVAGARLLDQLSGSDRDRIIGARPGVARTLQLVAGGARTLVH